MPKESWAAPLILIESCKSGYRVFSLTFQAALNPHNSTLEDAQIDGALGGVFGSDWPWVRLGRPGGAWNVNPGVWFDPQSRGRSHRTVTGHGMK